MARTTDFKASYKLYEAAVLKEQAKGARVTLISYEMYRPSYETQDRLNAITYARRYNPATGKYESTGRTLAQNKESIVKQLVRQSIDVPVRRAQEARKTILERQLEEQGLTGENRPSNYKIRKMIEAGELDVPSVEDLKGMGRAEAFMSIVGDPETATRDDYKYAEEIFYPEKAARRGMPKEQRQAERKAQREALAALMKRGS